MAGHNFVRDIFTINIEVFGTRGTFVRVTSTPRSRVDSIVHVSVCVCVYACGVCVCVSASDSALALPLHVSRRKRRNGWPLPTAAPMRGEKPGKWAGGTARMLDLQCILAKRDRLRGTSMSKPRPSSQSPTARTCRC